MNPRRVIEPTTRDETGALIFGSPTFACPWCQAPAELTYGPSGKAAVWHAPLDCCDKARKRTKIARARSGRDEATWHDEPTSLERSRVNE